MGQIALTRPHPAFVALDGVDLAVMADQTKRLGALPGREGIRAKALMKDRQCRLEIGVAQVRIEVAQFLGEHQPFVNNGAAAKAGNVEALYTGPARRAIGAIGDSFAGQVKQTLELIAGGTGFRGAAHNHLFHPRAACLSAPPQCAVDDRHRAEG